MLGALVVGVEDGELMGTADGDGFAAGAGCEGGADVGAHCGLGRRRGNGVGSAYKKTVEAEEVKYVGGGRSRGVWEVEQVLVVVIWKDEIAGDEYILLIRAKGIG